MTTSKDIKLALDSLSGTIDRVSDLARPHSPRSEGRPTNLGSCDIGLPFGQFSHLIERIQR